MLVRGDRVTLEPPPHDLTRGRITFPALSDRLPVRPSAARAIRAADVPPAMLLTRLYDATLAQASYLVGCHATGEALVVDPARDVEPYLRAARAEGLRVTHVAETHIHADYLSGARELARRAGATLLLSAEGGEGWQYRYVERDRAAGRAITLLRDGDTFAVGNVVVEALHTPGHTPEHLAYLVTDTRTGDRPVALLSGDALFVGDVGRPDLLERAAGEAQTMEASARRLFATLQRLKRLPDFVQLWPGHGAGSACGKALGAMASSTIGYERLFNWALVADDEEAFVRQVLDGQPEPPAYFAHMKRINRDGPPALGDLTPPPALAGPGLAAVLDAGALVVDTRPAAVYAGRHVPGTVNVPLDHGFAGWAGALLPYDRPLYLLVGRGDGPHSLADDTACAEAALRDLRRVGLDDVRGWFAADALLAWVAGGRELASVPQVAPAALAARAEDAVARGVLAIVDVRTPAEFAAGHVPGAVNVPLAALPARFGDLPTDVPLVVQCQGGARSAIAASLLRAHGRADVENLVGGFAAWRAAGLPVAAAGDAVPGVPGGAGSAAPAATPG